MARVASRLFFGFCVFWGLFIAHVPLFAFLWPYFLWLNADIKVAVKTTISTAYRSMLQVHVICLFYYKQLSNENVSSVSIIFRNYLLLT